MAIKHPSHDAGSRRIRSPIQAATVLLSIYIGMYLAVWVVLRVLTSQDAAAAIAPPSSMGLSAAATASPHPIGVGESPQSDPLGEVSEPTDNSQGCRPSAPIDSSD